VAAGCRNLLAAILLQALKDEALDGWPRRDWPWTYLHPRAELDAFWRSEWFESICDWLDLDADRVRQVAKAVRDGRRNT